MPSAFGHVPALPAMGPALLLRVLLKSPKQRPRHSLPAIPARLVTEYRLDRLPVDEIARYRAAFGFDGDRVPLTWWYLPAQRAHLATMLAPGFPYRIAGLVHMDNGLRELGPARAGEPLLLRTALTLLRPSSSGALRCVLETTGSSAEGPVFACSSTYLVKRGAHGGRPAANDDALDGEVLGQWSVDAGAGRRYARLSGDWNPIHLAGWSARLMGMRAPIIHGMHSLASACAALEHAAGKHASAIGCRFRAPIALGSAVTLRAAAASGDFVVESAGKAAVTGTCTLA